METIEQIETCEKMNELIDSWMEDTEDNAEAHRVVEKYYQKKELSESNMKVVVYGFFIVMIIGTWISPWDWVHWLARVILTVVYIAIICAIRSLDKAPVYPGHIPTNREEEMINGEMRGMHPEEYGCTHNCEWDMGPNGEQFCSDCGEMVRSPQHPDEPVEVDEEIQKWIVD